MLTDVASVERRSWGEALAAWLSRPLVAALLALGAYLGLAAALGFLGLPAKHDYYNQLADAMLHGQLHLREETLRSTHDLSHYQGRYYLYWGPFPALLLLPFVAIFGVDFRDVLFNILLGAANVGLAALLLRQVDRRGVVALSAVHRAILVLCLAFGSVQLTLVPFGRVWFTAQLVALGCTLLAYLAAITLDGPRAPLLTGLAIGCALATRSHMVLVGLWPAVYLLARQGSARGRLRVMLLGLAPLLLVVALLGLYNWLRFGDALDNGLLYHDMGPAFEADYSAYGLFHPHYLPKNLRYQLLAYPFPKTDATFEGGSLFLLTPLFFGALAALWTARPRWPAWTLAGTCLLTYAPIGLLMGTGWIQFGPRYLLDFHAPLLLLTALGVRRWPRWLLAALLLVGVAHYLLGTYYLGLRIKQDM